MRRVWIAVLVSGVVLGMGPRIARVQPLDAERVLADRFGFSATEVDQVRAGQRLVKTLPASESELAVFGVDKSLALAVALLDRIISYYSLILFGFPAFLITKRGR